MNTTFKKLQTLYLGIWATAALFVGLSELEILPTAYLAESPTTRYVTDLVAVVLTFGGTFLALRLPAFAAAKREMADTDDATAYAAYAKWSLRQLVCLAAVVWGNAVIYYACHFLSMAQYGLLIALIAAIFCYPSSPQAFLSPRRPQQ